MVFANSDAAETWFGENDPEGVAFEYEVFEWSACCVVQATLSLFLRCNRLFNFTDRARAA
jgi:hypothetical protein